MEKDGGPQKNIMTVREAASKWNVSVRQVQMYCKQGVLKEAFKLGHAWVIPSNCPKPVYKFISDESRDRHQNHEDA